MEILMLENNTETIQIEEYPCYQCSWILFSPKQLKKHRQTMHNIKSLWDDQTEAIVYEKNEHHGGVDIEENNKTELIQTEPDHKKVIVRVHKSDSGLEIIDLPKLNPGAALNDTRPERFKLVCSNVYRTCACLEPCRADSCACFGYLKECKDSCECGDSCSNTGLTMGEGKKVFLAASQVHGKGCIADEDIQEGEFVGQYLGEIVSKVDAGKQRNRSKFLFTIGDKDFVIDASKFGSELTRMNHKDVMSGDNCEFRLKPFLDEAFFTCVNKTTSWRSVEGGSLGHGGYFQRSGALCGLWRALLDSGKTHSHSYK